MINMDNFVKSKQIKFNKGLIFFYPYIVCFKYVISQKRLEKRGFLLNLYRSYQICFYLKCHKSTPVNVVKKIRSDENEKMKISLCLKTDSNLNIRNQNNKIIVPHRSCIQ
jgi:hypothetical protein